MRVALWKDIVAREQQHGQVLGDQVAGQQVGLVEAGGGLEAGQTRLPEHVGRDYEVLDTGCDVDVDQEQEQEKQELYSW